VNLLYNQSVLSFVSVTAEKSPFGVFGEMFSVNHNNSFDQTVPNLSSPSQLSPCSHVAQAQFGEHFSRKVFVGGLPPDIDEGTFVALYLSASVVTYNTKITVTFYLLYFAGY